MAETTEELARKPSEEARAHILLAEQNVDRLTDFCKRLLNKHGAPDLAETTRSYSLLKDLERIADQYTELAQHSLKNLLPALTNTHALLRTLYELFYAFNHTKAEQFIEHAQYAEKAATALLNNKKTAAAYHLAGIARTLNEMSWSVTAAPFEQAHQ